MRPRTLVLLAVSTAAVLLFISAGPPATFSVTVVNPTTQPVPIRDVDNPAFEPLAFTLCGPSNPAGPCPSSSFRIPSMTPAGQPVVRFVLEYVSGSCAIGTGSFFEQVAVVTSVNATPAVYQVTPVLAGANGTLTEFTISQQLRGYADPDSDVRLQLASRGPGLTQCDEMVSGYLVTR